MEDKVFPQLNFLKTEMKMKNLLVSMLAIVTVMSAMAFVAADDELASGNGIGVSVENILVYYEDGQVDTPGIVAGETVKVEVYFTSAVNDSDVTVQVEIEGEKVDVDAMTSVFDVEDGKSYVKTLNLRVPYELKDQLSDDIYLNIEIDGKEYKTQIDDIELRVQRPSYNANIMSVTADQNVAAGETFPVDIVIKNRGYNNLDDLYVTATIPELGVVKTAYFGDLVALECCDCQKDDICELRDGDCCDDDDDDTVSGRLYLKVPYGAKAGSYTLEVEVSNDDDSSSKVTQVAVENEFSNGNVIVTSSSRTVKAGEDAEYTLLLVNPTDKLKAYTIVTEASSGVFSSANEAVIAVPAGSSKTVTVTASADEEGEYAFNVNVFSGSNLESSVPLTMKVKGSAGVTASPVVVLAIILAIVFIVLLIVLIVLLGKKPEKSEEFGESYY